MTTTKTCPVCAKALDASRLAKHAHAVLCGSSTCALEYHRRQHNRNKRRWRDKRIAADPGFRLRAMQRCRDRYVKRRLAAGKTVGPPAPWAQREPVAPERGPIDNCLAIANRIALGVLRLVGLRFQA